MTCGDAGTSFVGGTIDGRDVIVSGATKNWGWVNVGNPKRVDGSFEGGSIHLEWAETVSNGQVTNATAATLTLASSTGQRTFQEGQLSYDSPGDESILKATLASDRGSVTVCMRKTG